MNMKNLFIVILLYTGIAASAQTPARQDTVIVELARSSKLIFLMKDRKDIEILRNYNFQQMFQDILTKIENKDTTRLSVVKSDSSKRVEVETKGNTTDNSGATINIGYLEEDEETDDEDWGNSDDHDRDRDRDWDVHIGRSGKRRTSHSFNVDLGMNNYLQNQAIPVAEPYAVRPWGSWYLAGNSIQRSMIARNFYLEWGLGMSFYNFKFQDENTLISKTDSEVTFGPDPRDVNFIKSKLSATYLNVSLVPVLDFGRRSSKTRMWDSYGSSFRIGAGGYVGYRIGSHSKMVYNDGGRERDKNRDSFYLNSLRYGVRAQIGIRSTDLFFNYDLNELFSDGKGPSLNAFSFGITF